MNDMEKKIVENIRSRIPGTESLSDAELMAVTAGSLTRALAECEVAFSDLLRELDFAFPMFRRIVERLQRIIAG